MNKVEIAPGYTVTTEMVNITRDSRDSSALYDSSRDSSGLNDSKNIQDSQKNEKDEKGNFELTQHKDEK